ncbi:echinoidin [Strongylocentrotus purpuratus]|uniref:C-type lectin domain-containing protein n=1 Tax=Strongylocentrotus purpuratus TaxID=7668 RepID=A0A7M7PM61_STRPU|nr:echinoidin [Strongylocentrotus purpuratus]
MLLLVASAILLLAIPTGVDAGCCCPTFWTAFDRHCYRLFSQNLTWSDAETFCQSYTVPSLGGGLASMDTLAHLVSVHSHAEQNFINILYETSRKKDDTIGGLWLGIHDLTTEGEFKWSDGSDIDYTAWAPRQPDASTTNSDCGVIRSGAARIYPGLWRDGPCVQPPSGVVHYFICKLQIWSN